MNFPDGMPIEDQEPQLKPKFGAKAEINTTHGAEGRCKFKSICIWYD